MQVGSTLCLWVGSSGTERFSMNYYSPGVSGYCWVITQISQGRRGFFCCWQLLVGRGLLPAAWLHQYPGLGEGPRCHPRILVWSIFWWHRLSGFHSSEMLLILLFQDWGDPFKVHGWCSPLVESELSQILTVRAWPGLLSNLFCFHPLPR